MGCRVNGTGGRKSTSDRARLIGKNIETIEKVGVKLQLFLPIQSYHRRNRLHNAEETKVQSTCVIRHMIKLTSLGMLIVVHFNFCFMCWGGGGGGNGKFTV